MMNSTGLDLLVRILVVCVNDMFGFEKGGCLHRDICWEHRSIRRVFTVGYTE